MNLMNLSTENGELHFDLRSVSVEERLGVEKVVGFAMEVLDGQPGNTIQLQVCLW